MKYKKILQIATLLLLSNHAFADNDPNRPTAAVSADLGITQNQFIACFKDVNPARGSNPTSARVHANKDHLLSCLQKANPSITNDSLDKVMDKHRPGGREAQIPIDGDNRPPPRQN